MASTLISRPTLSKPKPTKKDRPKKAKPTKGICPQCAYIFRGTPEHYPHCQKEIPVIVFRKNKTDRQMYKEALDSLCRLITTWRDGCTCVLSEVDGGKCSNVSQWGHVIPQGGSAYLVYELSNSFRQCSSHNKIHDDVNPLIYPDWYANKWGSRALKMLKDAQRHEDYETAELRDMVITYSDLYDMRFSFSSSTLADKVEAGFYGSIIREAWIKEGRI